MNNTRKIAYGAVIAALGVLIILILYVLLPVCPDTIQTASGASIPMRCHWMRAAETALAAALIAAGVLAALARSTETRITLYILTDVLGILVILTDTVLIGSCLSSTMVCSYGTKPAVLVAGIVLLALASAGILTEWRKLRMEKGAE